MSENSDYKANWTGTYDLFFLRNRRGMFLMIHNSY